tara:strand:+ start:577 stop:954 length:378 start_codon:yes stop_codon:yes gene_type:complete
MMVKMLILNKDHQYWLVISRFEPYTVRTYSKLNYGYTMTIRTVHQVINKSGTVIGEFMDIKLAKDLDVRTDVLYFIADLVETAGIDEATAEKVAEIMLEDNTRKQLLNQLKTVKNLPSSNQEKQD